MMRAWHRSFRAEEPGRWRPGAAGEPIGSRAGRRPGTSGLGTTGLGMRGWVGRRWAGRLGWGGPLARHLVLLACYVAAGIAVTWPRVTYLAGRLPATRDAGGYVWDFWWVARQVSHLASPWSTTYIAAPVGTDLGYHTLMPLPGLLMTPVTLAFGPSASYNLLSIACPGLLCYVMYRAARLWLPSQTGAIAAGALFGLSSILAWRSWYEVNLAAGALFLPMALEASVRLRRRPGRRQAIILGVVMGAAVLTDQESAVLAAIVTALVLLPWILRHPAPARLWPPALATAVGAVIATPQIVAMTQQALTGGASAPQSQVSRHGLRQLGRRAGTVVRPVATDRRLRPAGHRLALLQRPGEHGHGDVRGGPDGAGPVRAGGRLAAAQRPAARPAMGRLRSPRPRLRRLDRQASARTPRPDLAWRALIQCSCRTPGW